MRIQDMFERDIDRDINGVVKVAQEDEAAVEQELSEYVVTRELGRHFASFFDSYEHALDTPTDKVGVWISGFFGSGKSHFLKMLSYLLTNKVVAGKHAIEYFDGKFEDPMVDAKARRCVSVPTESILFNVDNKAVASRTRASSSVPSPASSMTTWASTARTSSSPAWSASSTTRASRRSSAPPSSRSTASPG